MHSLDLSYISPDLRGLAVPLETLKEDPENARLHGERNLETIKASLSRFGQRKNIVVRKRGRFIEAGNGTIEAARQLGWSHIAVSVVDDDKATATAYALADNRTAELAEWDDDVLALHLQALTDDGVDLSGLGWDEGELDALLEHGNPGVDGADADDVPDAPAEPTTKPGDLWIMGDHRLLCGDSTRENDVARLLDGETPLMMVTDPPYGVEYDANWRADAPRQARVPKRSTGKVTNDDRSDWFDTWRLFRGAVVYCWHASNRAVALQKDFESTGLEVRGQIIWKKERPVFSRGHYHWQHEPCWYAVRKGSTASWSGDRSQSTVWDIGRNDGEAREATAHSTQKPVECMARPIRNHGKSGDGVYDPFVGSGTTLIACEQLGRRCFAMEISPEYCDIVVARWEKFTGKTAERIEATS